MHKYQKNKATLIYGLLPFIMVIIYFFNINKVYCSTYDNNKSSTTTALKPYQDCTHIIYPIEDYFKCDSDNDHFEEFEINLEELEAKLVRNQYGLVVTYHNAGGDIIDFSIGTQFVLNQRTIIARATNVDGCIKETSFKLTLVSPPIVQILSDVKECDSYILPNIAMNNNYFTGINGSGNQLQAGSIINSTQTIFIYASRADCSDESEFVVTIEPLLCEEPEEEKTIVFNTFFTPNGDGINDFWYGVNNYNTWNPELENIEIYNRFGVLLNIINSNSGGWNGNFNGSPLPASDYWYKANLVNGNTTSGHFALKR